MQMGKWGHEGASLVECYQGTEWETKKYWKEEESL